VQLREKALKRAGLTYDCFVKEIKRGLTSPATEVLKVRGAIAKSNKNVRILATSGLLVHTKLGDEFADGDTIVEWDHKNIPGTNHAKYVEMLGKAGSYFPAEKNQYQLLGADGTPLDITITFVEAKKDGR
jgi:hypothetical protein